MSSSSEILPTTSSRATMESIKSVQENPFFKHFGIKHNVASVSRRSRRPETYEQSNRHSLNIPSSFSNNDDIGEYRPVSGFVHKLLDKFSLLSATRDDPVLSQLMFKRSSSLDEIENDATSKHIAPTDSILDERSNLTTNLTSPRSKSIENLAHSHNKPQPSSSHGILFELTDTGLDRNNQSSTSNLRKDNNHVNDNIIIIEKTSHAPSKRFGNDQSESIGSHDIVPKDEMPKPNTVLTVRSIFENHSQRGSHIRRYKSDQQLSSVSVKTDFLPLKADASTSSQDLILKRGSVQDPSPVTSPRHISENNTKSVLLPNNTSRSLDPSRHPSDLYMHTRSEDIKHSTSASSGQNYSESVTSQDNSNLVPSSRPAFDNTLSSTEGSDILASTKYSNSQPSLPSSRSTASVSPTKINNQSARSRPEPLSTPASNTTSYQKSRPVVSVAPYKDKPDDKTNEQLMVVTIESKSSLKQEESHQKDNDTKLSDLTKESKDEDKKKKNNNILIKEAKKLFENDKNIEYQPNNKVLSNGKNMSEVNNKTTENNVKNITVAAKNVSVVEVENTQMVYVNKEHDMLDKRSKSTEKESDLKSVKLIATSSTKSAKSKRMAPEPPLQLQLNENIITPVAPKIQHLQEDPNSSLYNVTSSVDSQLETVKDVVAPNKRSHTLDLATLNEQPLKKVIKDITESQEQPVKGIPSIISQRLKQQNSNPGHVAYDVVNPSDSSVHITPDSNNLYPRTLLTPVANNNVRSSIDLSQNNIISSDTENEISAVRRKMEANRSKSGGPAQIFDSSQLTKKKRNNQKQQTSSDQAPPVPSLDLSTVTTDYDMEYQPQLAAVKPCNIVFMGENAKTSRSLLEKKRKIKINITFNDLKTEMFEYLREEIALEDYLVEHPHEREELLLLEDVSGRNEESSDDVDASSNSGKNVNETLLSSNTSLAHSGNLQSYRGRYQEEYQFGAILTEQPKTVTDPEPSPDPEKLMLRPAEEADTNTWSTSDSSDLLF